MELNKYVGCGIVCFKVDFRMIRKTMVKWHQVKVPIKATSLFYFFVLLLNIIPKKINIKRENVKRSIILVIIQKSKSKNNESQKRGCEKK